MKTGIYDLLVRETGVPYLARRKSVDVDVANSPQAIVDMLNRTFKADKQLEEHVWIVCLDTKRNVLALFEVSHGLQNCSPVNPAGVLRRVLMSAAVTFVLAHNHPSGNVEPSNADANFTARLKKVSEQMGVTLDDSIIIGKNGNYYSFNEDEDCIIFH